MKDETDGLLKLDNGRYVRMIEMTGEGKTYRVLVESGEPFVVGGTLMVIGDGVMATGGALSRSAFAKELEDMAVELRSVEILDRVKKADQS